MDYANRIGFGLPLYSQRVATRPAEHELHLVENYRSGFLGFRSGVIHHPRRIDPLSYPVV